MNLGPAIRTLSDEALLRAWLEILETPLEDDPLGADELRTNAFGAEMQARKLPMFRPLVVRRIEICVDSFNSFED